VPCLTLEVKRKGEIDRGMMCNLVLMEIIISSHFTLMKEKDKNHCKTAFPLVTRDDSNSKSFKLY
jgi:hypothetical protein